MLVHTSLSSSPALSLLPPLITTAFPTFILLLHLLELALQPPTTLRPHSTNPQPATPTTTTTTHLSMVPPLTRLHHCTHGELGREVRRLTLAALVEPLRVQVWTQCQQSQVAL